MTQPKADGPGGLCPVCERGACDAGGGYSTDAANFEAREECYRLGYERLLRLLREGEAELDAVKAEANRLIEEKDDARRCEREAFRQTDEMRDRADAFASRAAALEGALVRLLETQTISFSDAQAEAIDHACDNVLKRRVEPKENGRCCHPVGSAACDRPAGHDGPHENTSGPTSEELSALLDRAAPGADELARSIKSTFRPPADEPVHALAPAKDAGGQRTAAEVGHIFWCGAAGHSTRCQRLTNGACQNIAATPADPSPTQPIPPSPASPTQGLLNYLWNIVDDRRKGLGPHIVPAASAMLDEIEVFIRAAIERVREGRGPAGTADLMGRSPTQGETGTNLADPAYLEAAGRALSEAKGLAARNEIPSRSIPRVAAAIAKARAEGQPPAPSPETAMREALDHALILSALMARKAKLTPIGGRLVFAELTMLDATGGHLESYELDSDASGCPELTSAARAALSPPAAQPETATALGVCEPEGGSYPHAKSPACVNWRALSSAPGGDK